jgi:tight adherence protein C
VILCELTYENLVPWASFGAFAALAWWAMEAMASRGSRASERLDELKRPHARRGLEDASPLKRTDAMTKVLERASPVLAKSLAPKSAADIGKLKIKLSAAGFRGDSAGSIYLGLKFVGLMVGLLFGTALLLAVFGVGQKGIVVSVGCAAGLFYLPDVVVWYMGKKRRQSIFLALPDALDLMVVCVEAGLALDQAMRKVADEMKKTYRILAAEFALANFQLQVGRPRAEVLHDLGVRNDVSDLRGLASVLIQADKFGSSVGSALRVQSDSMRTRRRQLAEEKAAKTAVKLIFPLVLFIFPGIFVILVGPAAVNMSKNLFPAMNARSEERRVGKEC